MVEPLNNGHIGTEHFVLYRDTVLLKMHLVVLGSICVRPPSEGMFFYGPKLFLLEVLHKHQCQNWQFLIISLKLVWLQQ